MTNTPQISLAQLAKSSGKPLSSGNLDSLEEGARPTLNDIAESLTFSPGDGRIWLNDQRMMLMHGNSFGALRRELIDSLGMEKARGLFTRIGYLAGARDARISRERWPDADFGTLYKAQLHSLEGMVKVEPVCFQFDMEKGHFDGEYIWHDSIEADEHIAAYGIGSCPSCWMLNGYAMGHGSTLLGHLIIAREVSCRAMGDSVCRNICKSADLLGDIDEDMRYLNAETFVDAPSARDKENKTKSFSQGQARRESIASPYNESLVGVSAAFIAACHHIQRVALTDATVLFTGESGAGKEIFANTLHRVSKRADQAFVAVNCAAIPETLIEAELFGVERGAFTGATQTRPGRFERAEGGTLFLDEIGALTNVAQGKLLRALQECEIERVGGGRTIHVNVRVIAATNMDLRQAVRDGQFREDLFYRLNVFPIHLPPLRERRDDIPLLMNHFLNHYCNKYGRNIAGFSHQAVKAMLHYAFPGNIRELQNLVERGVIYANEGGMIDLSHMFISGEVLPREILSIAIAGGAGKLSGDKAKVEADDEPQSLLQVLQKWQTSDSGTISLEKLERDLVEEAVAQSKGNLSAAARLLGVSRSQIAYRCEKYQMSTSLDAATSG